MRGSNQLNPDRDGASFISKVLSDPAFRTNSVAYGQGNAYWWAVVDPVVHPLSVWQRSAPGLAPYSSTARALQSVVFTNGPMMGKWLAPSRQVTRTTTAWEFAKSIGIGLTAGLVVGLVVGHQSSFRYFTSLTCAGIGFIRAWRRTLTNWTPCGAVRSYQGNIDDKSNFNNEGQRHAWLGRFGSDFDSYGIGEGDLPAGAIEGTGGLLLLVRNYQPVSKHRNEPTFNQNYADLWHKKGVVAWGLVPIDQRSNSSSCHIRGVIVTIGSQKEDAAAAVTRLCAIGVRDAIATDQRAMAMMGSGQQFMVGPPPIHRQAVQRYGLCCR